MSIECFTLIRVSISIPTKGSGNTEENKQTCKSQRMGKRAVRFYFMDITWRLHSKLTAALTTCIISSQSKFKHRQEKGSF